MQIIIFLVSLKMAIYFFAKRIRDFLISKQELKERRGNGNDTEEDIEDV